MNALAPVAIILFLYMNLWFLVSVIKKRNDVADIAWGLGFVLVAWSSLFLSTAWNLRSILVCVLVSIWGLRLAWHIYRRNKGKPEDARYAAWRKSWGKWFYLRSYLHVFLLQGALLFIIALPIFAVHSTATSFGALDILGLAIWLFGFLFESVADVQLAQFIRNKKKKGALLQTGLWKYSRHPNYFGEVTQWWGIWILSLSSSYGWIALAGPLTITFLILKVSGIPMLEKKMREKPGFQEYKRKTSVFVPWFPKY